MSRQPTQPTRSKADFLRAMAQDRPDTTESGDTGMVIVAYLLAGIGFYGGLGWVLDHFWLHTGWLLPVGLLVGMVLSVYLVIRRYGEGESR